MDVIVPVDKTGNRIANMVLAAQMRSLIQNSIRTYREKEMLASPKDLKDLAEAMKSLEGMSRNVYAEDASDPNGINGPSQTPAMGGGKPKEVAPIEFDVKPKEEEKTEEDK